MATKEHKRQAKGLIESLEARVHSGPPIHHAEIHSAREFLLRNAFPPSSDYFSRLGEVQTRLGSRTNDAPQPAGKRNYGGEAAGYWMQVQSAYDHVILSTCYEGDFNLRHGRIKISHRFNQAGRVDFVEAKLLRSLEPCLNGEIRKLVLVKNYQALRNDWHVAEAFVLPVLPRELIFLYADIFRCPRSELLAWLVNIGHRLVEDLLQSLAQDTVNGVNRRSETNPNQLVLPEIRSDSVAMPIFEKAAGLECTVESLDDSQVEIGYCRTMVAVPLRHALAGR